MKKISLAFALFLSFCFGATLDTAQTQMYWEAYKLADKTAVKGSFADVKYKFGKKNGVSGKLLGATATIDLKKIVTGNPVSENNLTLGFFQKFNEQNIKVKLEQVMEGENQGTILAKVTMNKKSQLVPMQYKIENGKLVAKGVIDILSFNLSEAFESLSKLCNELHDGHTWSQVEIGFAIPVK